MTIAVSTWRILKEENYVFPNMILGCMESNCK
jgi:hypothetical protein